MKTKPILAVLAGGATAFFLGWMIFGLALAGFYEANMTQYEGLMKTSPAMWGYVIGSLLQAGLLTYIFYLAGIASFGKGFVTALIITFLISAGYDLYFYNGMNLFSGQVLVVDVIVNTLMGALIGGVVALVLGTSSRPTLAQ